jgi:hypothetical protein
MTTRVARRATRTRVQMQHRRHRAASKLKKRDFSFLLFLHRAGRNTFAPARTVVTQTPSCHSYLLFTGLFTHSPWEYSATSSFAVCYTCLYIMLS